MNDSEQAQWAPPSPDTQPKTAIDQLRDSYSDRDNPDDMDNMVDLPGERHARNTEASQVPEDGTEVELVVDGPFSIGREITIIRGAKGDKPAYQDSGWKIVDSNREIKDRTTGQLKAAVFAEKTIDGKVYGKLVSTTEVLELNPEITSEKEPLSDTEQEVAELAIEVSSGIEDPSEIDEGKHMFTKSEMHAMREAAKRVSAIEMNETDANPYDALFDPNAPDVVEPEQIDVYTHLKQDLPPVTRGDSEASQKYYDRFVTAENKQVALEFLGEAVKADAKIAAILSEAGLSPTDMAAVDAIRENPDVRYKIAKRLTQKLDMLVDQNPLDFGRRIADNSPGNLKVDPETTKRMRSRVYAVEMALKMLGGEFSEKRETNDFARDSNDRVAVGQHRHAARTAILSRYA